MEIVVATGGGFDPVHKGHIRLLKEAKKLGTKLIVILNSDEQLKKKKGKTFYPSQAERKEILESIRYVDEVIIDPDTNVTCENSIEVNSSRYLRQGRRSDSGKHGPGRN